MRKILILSGLAPVLAFAQAPQWSGSIFKDVKNHHIDAVVMTHLTDLTIHGRKTGFGLDAFAGSTVTKDGKAVAGFSFGYSKSIFDQVNLYAGLGAAFSAGTPTGFGLVFGAQVNIGPKPAPSTQVLRMTKKGFEVVK